MPSARGRSPERLEIVRAAQLLYEIDEGAFAISLLADMGENGDPDALVGLGEVTARHGDARGMLLMGKAALNRGLPFDFYAYPVNGIPSFRQIGPEVEKSIVYAIARQESAFNPSVVSPAKAYGGLMKVTPDAARYVCKRHGATYDLGRLKNDPVYNVTLGAAELGGLLEDYRGSYIMTFAAYNAGRGSVKKWVERYGDPRDPKVDAVDWVELIPFSETRNYVQRIMENLQVYRARFGGGTKLQIEATCAAGRSSNRRSPADGERPMPCLARRRAGIAGAERSEFEEGSHQLRRRAGFSDSRTKAKAPAVSRRASHVTKCAAYQLR